MSWVVKVACAIYGSFFCLFWAREVMTSSVDRLESTVWVPLPSTNMDETTGIAKGDDPFVYISGYTLGGKLDSPETLGAFLIAFNMSGDEQWIVRYGSTADDIGNAVAVDATGVYMAGTTTALDDAAVVGVGGSDSGGQPEITDTDAFVVKYNSSGHLLWERSWGTPGLDLANGVAVDEMDGLVYVVGTTKGSMGLSEGAVEGTVNAGGSDIFLSCLGAMEGELKWTVQVGSAAADVANQVAVGPRGGVYLVGQLGDDEEPSVFAHAFLAKYDYLGNSQFIARLNSSSQHYAVDLGIANGGGGEGIVYVSGYTLGNNAEVFLARLDGQSGQKMWMRYFGSGASPHYASSMAVVEGHEDLGLPSEGTESSQGPTLEGVGEESMVVVVGYNTSEKTHASTGFMAVCNSVGEWVWSTIDPRAKITTAVAIGPRGDEVQLQGSGGGITTDIDIAAFVVGNIVEEDTAPGMYLYLNIQEVVWEESHELPPSSSGAVPSVSPATLQPTEVLEMAGGVSSTTGLSQSESLWLLIIGPVLVVGSCIILTQMIARFCLPGVNPGEGNIKNHDEGGEGGRSGKRGRLPSSRELDMDERLSPMKHSTKQPTTQRRSVTRLVEGDWHSVVDSIREKVTKPRYQELGEGGNDGEGKRRRQPGEVELRGRTVSPLHCGKELDSKEVEQVGWQPVSVGMQDHTDEEDIQAQSPPSWGVFGNIATSSDDSGSVNSDSREVESYGGSHNRMV